MFGPIGNLFTVVFYQPVYNVLILIYDGLGVFMHPADMGIAVLILTVLVRIVLYPLIRNQDQSLEDQHKVSEAMEEIDEKYKYDPIRAKKAKRSLMWKNKKLMIASIANITIQVIIAIVFYLIFTFGLEERDPKMLYSFVPQSTEPFNLIFLGRIDLSQPSLLLNIINSVLIFVVESLAIYVSAYPASREDRIVQYLLPFVAFLFFSQMPAGKKLFVIGTLSITTILLIIKAYRKFLYNTAEGRKQKKILARQSNV